MGEGKDEGEGERLGWMEGWKRLVRRPRSSTGGGGSSADKDEETTAEPNATAVGDGGTERAAGEIRRLSKGSYYNKFVGGLRSGNNSELRATLRMCLSLLLFKWKWKATSCNGCDLYLLPSLLCTVSSVFIWRSVSFESPSPSFCLFEMAEREGCEYEFNGNRALIFRHRFIRESHIHTHTHAHI